MWHGEGVLQRRDRARGIQVQMVQCVRIDVLRVCT